MKESPLDNQPGPRGIRGVFSDWHFWFAITAIAAAMIAVGWQVGRRQAAAERKPVWLSDLFEMNGGGRKYVIDIDLKCPGGQDLGHVQADLNMDNATLRIVRNDPREHPICPPVTPAAAPTPPPADAKPKAKK